MTRLVIAAAWTPLLGALVILQIIAILAQVYGLLTISATSTKVITLSHGCHPEIRISLSSGCIPLIGKQKLRLDIMDVGELALEVIDSLTGLAQVLLVVVCLVGDAHKQFFNILQGYCTGLNILKCFPRINPVGGNLSVIYLPLVALAEVVLVADQDDGHHEILAFILPIVVHTLKEVIAPLLDAFVRLAIGDVEDDHAAVGSPVESVTQALESLLTGSVPYLEGNQLTRLCFHFLLDEVCADCRLLRNAGFFVLVALDEAGLSDARVPNHHDLQKLFILTAAGLLRARVHALLSGPPIGEISAPLNVLSGNEVGPVLNLLLFLLA